MLCPTLLPDFSGSALRRALGCAAILIAVGGEPLAAQWRVEGWFGDAIHLPTPVTFHQAGSADIAITGHWDTEPWKPTWYYGGEIAHWSGDRGWAFQYMHHKMYMTNPPDGVEYFRVTNGVNFLLAERLWRSHGWEYGVGAGPVFAVPVSSVHGQVYGHAHGIFHSEYELAGLGLEANITRRLRLLPFTYGLLSLKATAATLHNRIANGHAGTDDLSLHLQYGISLQSKAK